MQSGYFVSTIVITASLAVSAASAQDFFSTDWQGGSSQAAGVSDDGTIGVTAENEDFDTRAVLFRDGVVVEDLGTLGGSFSEMGDVSGTIVAVGGARNAQGRMRPFRDPLNGPMQDLGDLGGQTGFATAVDFDGDVVAGWSLDATGQEHAFRWTEEDGIVNLGTFGGIRSMSLGVSGDGATVVGWARTESEATRAFRWTEAEGLVNLETFQGGGTSQAEAANADGSLIVGSAIDGNGVDRAFRWTEDFALEALPLLQEGFDSTALDVSADGSLIVGRASDQDGFHAVMWDGEGSLSMIQEVFAAIVPAGWTLERAESVSASGRYIAGTGFGPNGQQGWLIDRGETNECYPDFTGEGDLDLFDFLEYVNAFNDGEDRADCTGEGALDLFDFLCFVNAFNDGC
jgi:probable HAF family extracellular repeat protein